MDVFICTIVPWPLTWAPYGFSLCLGTNLQVAQYQAVYSLIGVTFGGSAMQNFNLPDLRGRSVVGCDLSTSPGKQLGSASVSLAIGANNLPLHTHAAAFTPVVGTQNVTLAASPPSGSLTTSVSAAVVAGIPTSSVQSPVAGSNYYLTGASAKAPSALSGLYTSVAPAAGATANLQGITATTSASSDYSPAVPARTVAIQGITNGSVTVQPGGGGATQTPLVFNNYQPSLTMNFMMCLQGIYPVRD